MRRARLPLVVVPRTVVPGTRAGLPARDPHLTEGELVVLLPPPSRPPGGVEGRVGTLAEVEEVRRLSPDVSLARLSGRSLVRLKAPQHRHGRWWVEAVDLPEPGPGAAAMVEGVERALRRYLALRAEAGEAAPAPIGLSRDPVTASHEVASRVQVSWLEVQEILEAGTAGDRLRRAQAVLEREGELLRRLLGREGT